MTDKATPSPASVDSVMAKAMMLVGALDDSCEEATSLPFLEAVTALRAEVERLAAQAAPTEPKSNLEAIRGAVARGWCHPKNSHKAMDSDLALAIADEVSAINAAPVVQAVQATSEPPYGWTGNQNQPFDADRASTVAALKARATDWQRLYDRAINEANGLTNYVEDRPELRSAERRLDVIAADARALKGQP